MTDPTRSAALGWLAGVLPSARPPPGEGIHLGKNGEGEGEGGGEGGSEYLSGKNREREPSGFSVIQLVNSCLMDNLWIPAEGPRNRLACASRARRLLLLLIEFNALSSPLLLLPSFIQQVACVGGNAKEAVRRPVDCSKMAKTST